MSRAGVLGVVLALVGLAGCASGATRKGADELRDALGTPSWASQVDVTTGRDGDRFKNFVQTTVTLKPAATAGEVSDFVDGFSDRVGKSGLSDSLDNRRLRFVAANGSVLDIRYRFQQDTDVITAGVAGWFQVTPLFPTTVATLTVDGGTDLGYATTYRIDLGASTDDAVAAAYDELLPLHLGTASFDVLSNLDSATGRLTRLEADQLPTPAQLAQWRAYVAASDRFPAELPSSAVTMRLLFNRAVADLTFLTPEDVTPETMTVGAYGDRLLPAIRPAVAAVHGLPGPWTFSVSWAPTSMPTFENLMVSVLSDQPIIDNHDASTVWCRQVKEYATSLG